MWRLQLLEYRYGQVWIIAKRWKQSPVSWFLENLQQQLELFIATSSVHTTRTNKYQQAKGRSADWASTAYEKNAHHTTRRNAHRRNHDVTTEWGGWSSGSTERAETSTSNFCSPSFHINSNTTQQTCVDWLPLWLRRTSNSFRLPWPGYCRNQRSAVRRSSTRKTWP